MIKETIQATLNKTGKGRVFFITDPHFGHTNLCEALRGMTAEESDNLIIKNWNSVVKSPYDTVYIGGDLTMEKPQLFERVISKLNGRKVIIGGNHDDRKSCELYQRLGITIMGCLEYKGYIFTHIPILKSEVKHYRGNIHGHIHTYELPSYKYINMTADLNGMIPRTLDYIIAKQRSKKSLKSYLYLTYKLIRRNLKHKIKKRNGN